MRTGSIGLPYATQIRAPHCSHWQLNDGVDGIGTSSTRGQASTSRNSEYIKKVYAQYSSSACAKSSRKKIPVARYLHTASLISGHPVVCANKPISLAGRSSSVGPRIVIGTAASSPCASLEARTSKGGWSLKVKRSHTGTTRKTMSAKNCARKVQRRACGRASLNRRRGTGGAHLASALWARPLYYQKRTCAAHKLMSPFWARSRHSKVQFGSQKRTRDVARVR
jgi:hypothetical protein